MLAIAVGLGVIAALVGLAVAAYFLLRLERTEQHTDAEAERIAAANGKPLGSVTVLKRTMR